MPKPVKVVLLSLIVVAFFIFPAYASPQDLPQDTEDSGGLFEKMLAAPLNGLAYAIVALENSIGGMETFEQLVFNVGDKKYGDPFTASEWALLDKWYKAVASSMSCLVLIAVFVTALRTAAAGINPIHKFSLMDDMLRWFYALVIIAGGPLFVWICIVVNNALVAQFYELGTKISGSMQTVAIDKSFLESIHTGSPLTTAIVRVSYAFISLYFNVLYLIRKIVLIVMYVFTPLMAWMWAINKRVAAVTIWVSEVVTTTFMQATHALAFAVWTSFSGPESVYHYWLPQLIGLGALIPITRILRNAMAGLLSWLMGTDEELWAAGFTGLAALGASMMPRGGFSPLLLLGKGSAGFPMMNLSGIPAGSGEFSTPGTGTGSTSPGTMSGSIPVSFGGAVPGAGMPGNALNPPVSSTGVNIPGAGQVPGTAPGTSGTTGTGPISGAGGIPGTGPVGGLPVAGLAAGTSTPPGTVQKSGLPKVEEGGLTKAAMHGLVGGGVAQRIAAATAKVGAFPLGHGAEKVGEIVGGITGAATRGIATAGSIMTQTVAKHREGKSISESLKEVTGVTAQGGKGTAQAVFRAAAITGAQMFSPGSAVALANRWTPTRITSIDGIRHR